MLNAGRFITSTSSISLGERRSSSHLRVLRMARYTCESCHIHNHYLVCWKDTKTNCLFWQHRRRIKVFPTQSACRNPNCLAPTFKRLPPTFPLHVSLLFDLNQTRSRTWKYQQRIGEHIPAETLRNLHHLRVNAAIPTSARCSCGEEV